MINKFFKYLSLHLNPPRRGDVFFGDAFDFMCDSNSERIFYPLIDRNGHTTHHFVQGDNTYRFTIENSAMPYYVCRVEILTLNVYETKRTWLKRSLPKRMWKKDFHRLILQGRMKKTTVQSLYK
jgi:hypothetical protein